MIELRNISVRQSEFSLQNVSLRMEANTYYCLVGKTGTGKTTLIEILCGLRRFESGSIWLDGQDATLRKPGERDIGFVPQDLALFGNMTVAENIGFALKIRKVDRNNREEKIKEMADLLGISHLLHRLPKALSGGEKQRVAIGRAVIFQPAVLLLDEPFNALDQETKQDLFKLLRSIKSKLKMTVLHITHNRDELENMAEMVVHLKDGQLSVKTRKEYFTLAEEDSKIISLFPDHEYNSKA
jgi:ABC-type sugar transport system ATPase subunit